MSYCLQRVVTECMRTPNRSRRVHGHLPAICVYRRHQRVPSVRLRRLRRQWKQLRLSGGLPARLFASSQTSSVSLRTTASLRPESLPDHHGRQRMPVLQLPTTCSKCRCPHDSLFNCTPTSSTCLPYCQLCGGMWNPSGSEWMQCLRMPTDGSDGPSPVPGNQPEPVQQPLHYHHESRRLPGVRVPVSDAATTSRLRSAVSGRCSSQRRRSSSSASSTVSRTTSADSSGRVS